MSTAAVSNISLHQELQQYFQARQGDVQQLGQALKSGDLAGAQTAYAKIAALGQNGPFAGGNPFQINQREQAFSAIGTALQSGDLAGAQQAFSALKATFTGGTKHLDPPLATPPASPSSSSGPEIVLNLSNSSASSSPEQITISISNPTKGGGEQVSLSVGNQGSNAQQITLNLNANSNEQIILNFLGAASSTSSAANSGSSSGSASGGISVSA
jgi:hypothetical protein